LYVFIVGAVDFVDDHHVREAERHLARIVRQLVSRPVRVYDGHGQVGAVE
jgi:hypothetical protein